MNKISLPSPSRNSEGTVKQNLHSPASAKRQPRFGTLQGKIKTPEDRYLLNEPADVRAELYGEEYRQDFS